MMLSKSVKTAKAMATHFVALDSFESRDFPLFLDRYVSEPPPMTPERPAVLPDWSMTTPIRMTQEISCKIVMTKGKRIIPF